jgi:uncharacterized membrane protein
MEARNPTTRSRQVSRIASVLAGGVALLAALVEVMMLFSDLGPGETKASRNAQMLWVLVVGGVLVLILLAVSWLAGRRKG